MNKKGKALIRVASAILIIVMSIGLTGCSGNKEKITKKDYEQAKQNITLGCGMTVIELENTMIKFAYNVYNPQKESDIVKGIEMLKGITTEAEYNELLSIAGEYKPERKSTVTNVIAKYSPKENNADGMDKVLVEFTLQVDGYEQNTAIEFVFNPNNKIFKHYIWLSNITEG